MAGKFDDAIKNRRCFFCGRGATLSDGNDGYFVECKTCGKFHVGRTMLATIKDDEMELIPYLSIYTRQVSERGEKVLLNSANWKEIALASKQTPLNIKVDKLLELIAARSKPGHSATFDWVSDFPLVGASDRNELAFLCRHLTELGYAELISHESILLSAAGWKALQNAKSLGGVLGKCFVAMSFDDSLKDAYDRGIFLAVKSDCRLEPVRVDRVQFNDKICDKIIAEIRTCQFLVADVTLQRPGVYFEAGFAMGLGRPVIWSCREDDLKNVHFDTRQYNHIVWNEPTDLRAQLTDRIKATIPGAT